MDMDILLAIIKSVACPKCFEVSSLTLVQNAKSMALHSSFMFFCNNCKYWKNEFTTSTKKYKKFDINYKTVYAMRRCGKGYQGLRRFLAIINHPPPMTEKNYRKISHSFTEAARVDDAAEDIRCNDDVVVDIRISLDGTWQRRGFSAKKESFLQI